MKFVLMKLTLVSLVSFFAGCHHDDAIPLVSSGQYIIAIGWHAAQNMTTGKHDTCIGTNACPKMTSGSFNLCVGDGACPDVTTENDVIDLRGCPHGRIDECRDFMDKAYRDALATAYAPDTRT